VPIKEPRVLLGGERLEEGELGEMEGTDGGGGRDPHVERFYRKHVFSNSRFD
jgi:hypothetical protein